MMRRLRVQIFKSTQKGGAGACAGAFKLALAGHAGEKTYPGMLAAYLRRILGIGAAGSSFSDSTSHVG